MHLQKWIEHSYADYYTMFINAWIPFNAWYQDTYYDDLCRTDKQMIEKVKTQDNKYKNKLKNLLEGRGADSAVFRFHLAQLYKELNDHTIPNMANRLSFDTIWTEDTNLDSYTFNHASYSYKISKITGAARGSKQYRIEIINRRTGVTKNMIELFKKDMNELESDADFISLSNETVKQKVRECLSGVLRHKPAGIVKNATRVGRKPNHSIVIDAEIPFYLSDDIDLDAKAIIQLIYQLRCIIFHGDLEPSIANMPIYEHLYHIQKILIKELL